MGLPASQRRRLQGIESMLLCSDPRLAALFSLFTRLNRGEEMPRLELMRGRVARALAPLTRRLVAFGRWFLAPRRTRLRTALFFPVALGLVASTVLVGSSFPGNTRCTQVARTARATHTTARARRTKIMICPPTVKIPVVVGR
jgi:hypothetical protein